jgi:hypothetical protein
MRLFTVDEANATLSAIKPKLLAIRELYSRIEEMRPSARAAAGASDFGGGMEGGTDYVNLLYRLGELSTKVNDMGVELKDPGQGLIDFPSIRSGRVVYLCWRLDDGDQIEWWHETEAGFAGRQPL